MMTSLRQDASTKDLHPSPEEETQEEAPGVEPQCLLHGCEMPRMLKSPPSVALHKWKICVLVAPLSSISLQEEKQG